jgi:hypothetical protein
MEITKRLVFINLALGTTRNPLCEELSYRGTVGVPLPVSPNILGG